MTVRMMGIQLKNKELSFRLSIQSIQKLKFLFIGGSSALIYFGILFVLYHLMKVEKELSVTIGYFSGVMFHFLMNKFFVFEEKNIHTVTHQIPLYIALTFINYLINLATVFIISFLLKDFSFNIYLGVIIATGITMILTYMVMNRIIFKKKLE